MTQDDGEGLKASFLNCLYTNPTCLNNKMPELQAYLEFEDFPHLIFITETWFKPEMAEKTELHKCDISDREGCVTALYVRSDLISREVMDQSLRGGLVKQVWCRVTVGSDRILVECICRPEKSESSDEELIPSLKSAHELVSFGSFDSLLVAGDLKMGSMSWSEGSGFESRSFEERFAETLDDCLLSQCV